MAVVYKAYDTYLEREVAVKVIRRNAFSPDALERVLKRFDREAKSLARLIHPNIIPLIDYGEHEGNPYLVMPYLAGGTLKQYLGQPMLYHKAAALLMPVAEALAYAHQKSIVHRDVKPGNILITENGKPMLGDFGVARLLENEETQTLTGTGVGVGTPEYMSPEQGLGREVDGRTDVYSLGVVLYELVTGRKPYTADTPMAVVLMQTTEPLPRPRNFVPELPEQVEHVLFKALQKNSADRYQEMGAFSSALAKLIIGQNEVPAPQVKEVTRILTQEETDNFVTVDQGVSPQLTLNPVAEEMSKRQSKSMQRVKKVFPFTLGGIVVFVIIIGAISGWFRGKTATTEEATEAPIRTEAPATTKSTTTVEPVAGTEKISDKDDMVMVYVPTGEFTMGSPSGLGDDDEHPEHQVFLSGFWIDQTEITNGKYEQCVNEGGCTPPKYSKSYTRDSYYGNPKYNDFPVIYVDWNQAESYCQWAGRELPTEAQWEKASRWTVGYKYPWGNRAPTSDLANYRYVGDTTEVGSYPEGASQYGALDMAGNVWEWVKDWYGENYYSNQSTWNNPRGPSIGDYRSLRGGSWVVYESGIRSANRGRNFPAFSDDNLGFRCSLSVSESP